MAGAAIRAGDWIQQVWRAARPLADAARPAGAAPVSPRELRPIRRVVLTDDVSRTLFGEYAQHRAGERGREEIGWVLLGLRAEDAVLVLATIPAGENRSASDSHVQFNGVAQAFASQVVRQDDRRLMMLGVVHTQPGSMRHPTPGDLRGDRVWVANLRGGEGVFAIGTASGAGGAVSAHPAPHAQELGGLRFDWYTLAAGAERYEPVAVTLEIGPDLAAPLRPVWEVIEAHAPRLERLARQFRDVRFEVGASGGGPALLARVGLGASGESARVLLHGKTVRVFHEAGGTLVPWDVPAGTPPDQGVYLLLAELAARG